MALRVHVHLRHLVPNASLVRRTFAASSDAITDYTPWLSETSKRRQPVRFFLLFVWFSAACRFMDITAL